MSEEDLYKRAEKRADKKIGFYRNLYTYIIVNVILLVLNIIFFPDNWRFYWITIVWGIILAYHYIKTFIISEKLDERKEKMIENEMEKMKK